MIGDKKAGIYGDEKEGGLKDFGFVVSCRSSYTLKDLTKDWLGVCDANADIFPPLAKRKSSVWTVNEAVAVVL